MCAFFASLGAKLTADSRDLDRGLDRAEDKLKKTKGEIDNTTGSTKKMNKASSQASAVLFSFSQGAQDAAFSISGAANNIEPMLMQFGRLKKTTGSTMGALKSLGGAMLGPAGIAGIAVTAFTVISTKWDDIKGVFTETAEEAEESAERIGDAFDNVFAGFSGGDVEQAEFGVETARNAVKEQKEEQEVLNALLDEWGAEIRAVNEQRAQGSNAQLGLEHKLNQEQSEMRDRILEQYDAERLTVQMLEEELTLSETVSQKLQEQLEQRKANLRMQRKLLEAGGQTESEGGGGGTDTRTNQAANITNPNMGQGGLATSAQDADNYLGSLQGVAFAQERVAQLEQRRDTLNQQLSMRLEQQSAKWQTATAYGMTFANSLSSGIGNAVNTMLKFENGIGSIAQAFVGFGKAAVGALKDVVVQMTTAIAKAAVLKGIMSVFGLGSIGGVSGSFGNVFSSVLGFAEGGIVTGPTLGLIGEAGESEAVIPLSKLDSMMRNVAGGMGGGQLVSRIDMDELVIAIERHREFQTT